MGKLRVKGINLEVLAKYAHGLLSNPLFGVSEITVTNDSGPSRPRSSHTNRSWHQDIDLEAPISRRWPNGRSEPDFIIVDDYHPKQYAVSGYPTYTQPSQVPVARSNTQASRGQQQEPDRHYHGSHRSHTRLGVRTYQREDSSRARPEPSRPYDNDDRTTSEQSTRLRRESRSSRRRPSRGYDADIHHQPPELHTSNHRDNNHYERAASDLGGSLDSPMARHGRRPISTSSSHHYHSVREAADPRAPTQQHAHTQMRTTSSQHSLDQDHDHRSRSRRRDHRERHVPPSPGQASHRSSADSGYASGQRTPGGSRRRSRTSSSSPLSPWRGRDHRDGDGRSRPPIALDRAERRARRGRSGSSGERPSYRHH